MSWEDALIQEENKNGPKFALILDDHKRHIKGHLKLIYKTKILLHILQHMLFWWRTYRLGVPHIPLEEIVKAQNERD